MYHLLAIITCVIWGSTFVSTKILLATGLSPAMVFFLRFTLAYCVMLAFCHKRMWCDSLRDELLMLAVGVAGGSLFFYAENTALLYTQSGNVSFLTALPPLFLVIYGVLRPRGYRATWKVWTGAVLALLGIYFVSYGSDTNPATSPNPFLGNTIALLSSILWAAYQLIATPLAERYGTRLVTRKLFGYGVLTITPFIITELPGTIEPLSNLTVLFNLLFLGLIASLFCYFAWSVVMERIGAIPSANYLYINPVVTCIASYIFLGEQVSVPMMLGGLCIIAGVYISLKK
ncbi:MAG: DMT family transporter [Alloprevotella sp.]|nr:DMT family transporter [Alloprevotella sp.]